MFAQTVDRMLVSRAMLVKQIIWEVKIFEKEKNVRWIYTFEQIQHRFVQNFSE